MNRKFCSTLMLMSICVLTAHAQEFESSPSILIKGFGTAALTMTDTDEAEFIRPYQAAGATTGARTGVDSNFGLQVSVKFNDWLAMTGQGLVRKTTSDSYAAELALAFVRMKVAQDFTLRLGRLGLPVYLISDFRNVGYASTMLRPPNEIYRQVPVSTAEGFDLVFKHTYGETTVTGQFGLGRSEVRFAPGTGLAAQPLMAFNVIAENGPLTLRFGHTRARFSLLDNPALPGLLGSLRGAGLNAVADEIGYTDVHGVFNALGLIFDGNNFVFQGEYAKRMTGTRLVPDTRSWYTMLGYRYGKFTPYYYRGRTMQDSVRRFASMPQSGALAGLTAAANDAVKEAQFSTHALGLRWDFNKSAAFKLQIDRIAPMDGAGGFLRAKPGFSGPVMVFAAGIDFVF